MSDAASGTADVEVDQRPRLWSTTAWWIVAVLALVVGIVTALEFRDILRIELAGSAAEARSVVAEGAVDDARRAVVVDVAFIVLYVLALGWPIWAWRRNGDSRLRGGLRTGALVALLVAALADLVENWSLHTGLGRLYSPGRSGWPFAIAAVAASVKFVLLAYVVLFAVSLLRQPLRPPGEIKVDPPSHTPPAEKDWVPNAGKIGISCSGGGVRSATFNLGALQTLREHGVLPKARYVTAVSGGSYMATAWAVATGEFEAASAGAPPSPALFAPRSPEERWVRLHSSHLVSDPGALLKGALRLVTGALFGLLLLWLLAFSVAQPVGWLISSGWVHPQLRARLPIVETTTQPRPVAPPGRPIEPLAYASAQRLDECPATAALCVAPAASAVGSYKVRAAFTEGQVKLWRTTHVSESCKGTRSKTAECNVGRVALVTTSPGLILVRKGQAMIETQPEMAAVNPDRTRDAETPREGGDVERPPKYVPPPGFPVVNGDPSQASVVVGDQPRIGLRSRTVVAEGGDVPEAVAKLVTLERNATITHYSGMTGRPSIDIPWEMWAISLGTLAVGFVLYVVRILGRFLQWPRARKTCEWAGIAYASLGATLFVLLVVLPWCVQEVPPFLAGLLHPPGESVQAADGATNSNAVLAALGITGLLAVAIRAVGRSALSVGRAHLGLLSRLAVTVLLPLIAFLVFLDLLEFSTANGPFGRFLGFGIGMDGLARCAFAPSAVRLVAVSVLLIVLWFTVDAHSWSLYPFYKRRLNDTYATRRRDGGVEAVEYDGNPVLLTRIPNLTDIGHSRVDVDRDFPDERRGPELVVCCAANVSTYGVAPPGRRSVSFTFSADWVGSPELGWIGTDDYLAHLKKPARLSDATMIAAMAISGAAVSPGMGKMSRGALNGLLAVLNVRLGVWLPHPQWMNPVVIDDTHWKYRPGWTWYLREIVRRFDDKSRFLYVSDGGHWENLGLVELFRRGCTEIYCISAAGDGAQSFTTIAEALALAHELFGVEFIDLDLSPLRATGVANTTGRQLLRRRGTKAPPVPEAFAEQPFVVAKFKYPENGLRGRILFVEANLTPGIPWDVQAWAETSADFPDDPTGDQLFDHRQFESYRALGSYQVHEGIRSSRWEHAKDWVLERT